MAGKSIASIQYTQAPAPNTIDQDLRRYLTGEFQKIAAAIGLLAVGHVDVTHVAPPRPRDGDVRLADGTHWNPTGGGKGFYGYYDGAWHKLG